MMLPCLCSAGTADLLRQADLAYAANTPGSIQESLSLYEQVLEERPHSFEANWKAARAARFVAETAKRRGVDNWEGICSRFGKKGMEYASKAIELRPERVEGHFYYGLSVGNYADGVSIFTAIGQGLKGKTQTHLEKAVEIDKTYEQATPVLALGRFWEILPWPMRDRDKALDLYREAQDLIPEDSRFRQELQVYLGGLLLDMGDHAQEARNLLQEAARGESAYFRDWAGRILQEHK
jgi:tetratricopeptide (TPR) repeat protein